MEKKSLLAILVMGSALTLGGCAADHNTRNTASYQNDASLKQAVSTAVRGTPEADTSGVIVSVDNGVVTLSGHAPNQMAAQDAIEAARQVPGVKKVDYDINVEPQR